MFGINDNTQIMLHMDGADGSTTFTDSSLTPKTVTRYGDAQIDTDQSVFGGAAGLFDGNGDYLSVAGAAISGSGDLTLDFRVRFNSLPGVSSEQAFLGHYKDANNNICFLLYNNGGTLRGQINLISGGTFYAATFNTTLLVNTWYHFAFVRSSGDVSFYKDGTRVGSPVSLSVSIPEMSEPVFIGYRTGGGYLNGRIDELRYHAEAVWTSDFTPPASSYTPIINGDVTDTSAMTDLIDAQDMYGQITDISGMSDVIDALNTISRDTYTAGLSDIMSVIGDLNVSQSDIAGMSDSMTAGVEFQSAIAETAGMADVVDALNFSMILAMYGQSIRRYYCTLTGAEDSLSDLSLPIATLQARLRQGDPNYLSVTIPGMDYASAITARSNGQLVIHMAIIHGGTEVIREEIARVTLDAIRTDEGGKSKTITLSGHRTVTYPAQITALRGVTYKSLQESGKLSFRCAEPDLYLRPGDTCKYGDDSFVAGLVQYTISPKSQSMTVTEADA